MDIPAIARTLIDAGGWGAFLTFVVAAAVTLLRGDWVPGFVYRREVARADVATNQAERNADAIEDLTDVLAKRPVRRRRTARASA